MNLTPYEDAEQEAVFRWAEIMAKSKPRRYAALSTMFAVPNGGRRDKVTAARLKRTGVKAGVPDIFLPVPRGGHHGLFVEMKREKGGRISDAQKKYMEKLAEQGYLCAVCHGAAEATEAIMQYMNRGYTHADDVRAELPGIHEAEPEKP